MDPLDIAWCALIENDNSTIRAACLRTPAIGALITKHPTKVRLLRALARLVRVKTGFAAIAPHTVALVPGLLASCDTTAEAAAKLLVRLPVSMHVRADHVVRLISLFVGGKVDQSTFTSLIVATPVEHVKQGLRRAREINVLTDEVAQSLLVLMQRSQLLPGIARLIERSLIKAFIERSSNPLVICLINNLLPHLTLRSYRPRIGEFLPTDSACLPTLINQTATAMLFRYKSIGGAHVNVSEFPNWRGFVTSLASSLEQTSNALYPLAPSFLLMLSTRRVDGYEACIPPLKAHLKRRPSDFRFQPTEDLEALGAIIACGEKLEVDVSAWRAQKDELEAAIRQKERMKSVGIDEIHQPDAFTCPVTMETMTDPVVASDGHTYERSSLQRILHTSRISPLTREKLNASIIIPNINLKKRIRDYADDVYDAVVNAKRVSLDESARTNSDADDGEEALNV